MKLSTGDVTGGGEPESKYQTSSLVGWLGVLVGCLLSFFVIRGWLCVFRNSFRRGDKQARPLHVGFGVKGPDRGHLEAGGVEMLLDGLLGEAKPDVTHLLLVLLPVVRQHVDHQHAPAGLQHAVEAGEIDGGYEAPLPVFFLRPWQRVA